MIDATRGIAAGDMMLRPELLAGRRILVTGGGTGLGRIMAEGCAALGASVHICGRRGGVVDDTARDINARHGEGAVFAHVCDIRERDAIEAMLDQIWTDHGALDGLVNNAAANFVARAEDISANGFDVIADTVFRAGFLLTTACGRRWIKAGHPAAVVSILTTWIWNGGPFSVPSTMSKAGLHSMTQSLAVEWGRHGIRLNAICPGAFTTEAAASRLLTEDQGLDAKAANPLGRAGHPVELANLAAFLLGPGSEFINGQMIAIDAAGYQENGANFSGMTAWSDADWAAARDNIRRNTAADKASRNISSEMEPKA